jgi:DNA-binding MurR/RpiR family transcriptional regulator
VLKAALYVTQAPGGYGVAREIIDMILDARGLMKKNGLLDIARKTIKIEADAIAALADKLDDNFIKAVDLIDSTKGRVIVSGIGKSGNVAKKIASTFSSIGISAIFFHPTEGIHGVLAWCAAMTSLSP